jgi:2-dehydropantoate 2-reductase
MIARLTFGELDGTASPRATALLNACRRAGIEAILSSNIQQAIWEKFVFLTAVSGMTSLTRLSIGPIRSDPVTRVMLREAMEEVAAVGRAGGIHLTADLVDRQMQFCDGLPPDMISSMLGDLRRGSRLELDWLAGAVVRMGAEAGVATPVNRAVYAGLKLHANGAVG